MALLVKQIIKPCLDVRFLAGAPFLFVRVARVCSGWECRPRRAVTSHFRARKPRNSFVGRLHLLNAPLIDMRSKRSIGGIASGPAVAGRIQGGSRRWI